MTTPRFDRTLRQMSLVVALGAIMTVLDTTIVNVAVRVLGRELHASLSTIQWVLTGYTLALSMTIPITGWAIKRFGTKTLWITSLMLFIAGSVLCGAAWSAASLIAARVLQGIGGGLLMPVGQTMLARAAGPERMGRVMAVVAVPAMLAPALGPVLGGLLLDHLVWRWMFYINVPICALALFLAVRLLPGDNERTPGGRLDALGLALLSPGLAIFVYAMAQAGEGAPISSPRVLVGVIAGALFLAGFVAHALRRRDRALVDLRLFTDRGFATSVVAIFFYSIAMFGVLILVPLYDQTVRGGDTLDAGLLVAPLGAGAILTMLISGRLTDRYGPRLPGIAGIVVVLLGTSVLTQVETTTSVPLLAAATLIVGLGHGMVVPSVTAAAYQRLSKPAIPAATTAANIMVRVGSALGAAVLAIILQIQIRAAVPGADGIRVTGHGAQLAHAFANSFWWAFGIAAVALVPALLLPAPRPRPAQPSTEAPTAQSPAPETPASENTRT